MRIEMVLACTLLLACSKPNSQNDDILAKIGDTEIKSSTVDALIQPELYESLFNTYYARKLALEQIIADRLLNSKAIEMGISKDSLLSRLQAERGTTENLDKFVKDNFLSNGIPDSSRPGSNLPLTSVEGKKILGEDFDRYILVEFVSELKKVEKIEISLFPPSSPSIDVSGINYYPLNNTAIGAYVWIFSDFSCKHCQNLFPSLKRLVSKYEGAFQFRYTTLSADTNDQNLLAEYAGQRGKFKEAVQLLFEPKYDSTLLLKELKFSHVDFQAYKAKKVNLDSFVRNYDKIMNLGKFQATPTIIINDRVYYGESICRPSVF